MADDELPPHVRALIEASRRAPVHADRAAIRAKIDATLAGGGAAGGGGAAAGGTAKLVMGTALAVIVAGGGYLALRGGSAPATRMPPPAAIVESPPPSPLAVPVPVPVPVPDPPPPRHTLPHARIATPPATAPAPTAPPASPAIPDEATLLAGATRALHHGDATRALELVAEHRHEFARGALAEERDALEIEALLALDRHGEAADAARRFAASYPHSVHAPIVERALKPQETSR